MSDAAPAPAGTAPSPMVPAFVDLRGLEFAPLQVSRLMDSDFFADSTGDEFKAGVALWCKSWAQVPAGSLPHSDSVLAYLAGCRDMRAWRKVRNMALHGWILCSDGRLYHALIAENALAAWAKRLEFRAQKEADAERVTRHRAQRKQLRARLAAVGIKTPANVKMPELLRLAAGLELDAPPPAPAAPAAAPAAPAAPGDPQASERGRVAKLIRRAGILDFAPSDPRLIALIEAGVPDDDFVDSATEVAKKGRGFAYLVGMMRGRREDASALQLAPALAPGPDDWQNDWAEVTARALNLGLLEWERATDATGRRMTRPAYLAQVIAADKAAHGQARAAA